MNLVIHHPNGDQCIFSHAESEAASTQREYGRDAKRTHTNWRTKIRSISRRLESQGLTPRQEEQQAEGGAVASGSRGETEEVLQPPAMAGGQASDLAEDSSESSSYEPGTIAHYWRKEGEKQAAIEKARQEMLRNPPPWRRIAGASESDWSKELQELDDLEEKEDGRFGIWRTASEPGTSSEEERASATAPLARNTGKSRLVRVGRKSSTLRESSQK